MITEFAEIRVKVGCEAGFEAAVAEAAALFRAAHGCRHLRLERSIEDDRLYRLLVTWERVEDHVETFRGSPAFASWRALIAPFVAPAPPHVEHLTTVLDAF